jgi:co-chaperonin GroES (HSP10)
LSEIERILPTNEVVSSILGKNHPIPLGWQILLQTFNFGDNFVKTDGQKSLLERPDISKERDEWAISIGKVLMIGDAAFEDARLKKWKLLPIVGDYVKFYKYEGTFDKICGINCQWLQEAHLIALAPDPNIHNYNISVGN